MQLDGKNPEDPNVVKELLYDEVTEEFRDTNARIISIDLENRKVVFEFSYTVVPEDDYIGLNSY